MRSLGREPINETSAVGDSAKYDDAYMEIIEEIGKLDSLEFDTEVDFKKIVNRSIEILEKKSKDIFIAIYFSYSLLKINGIYGFEISIQILKDMFELYSKDLFPKNNTAQFNAFFWWMKKILPVLRSSEDMKTIVRLEENIYSNLFKNLNFLEKYINSSYEQKISFEELLSFLNTNLKSNKVAEEVEEDVFTNSISYPENKSQCMKKNEEKLNSTSISNITTESNTEVDLSLDTAFELILKDLETLSSTLIKNDNFDINLFLINRIKIWFDITELPMHDHDITYIKPPEQHEVEYLDRLYKEQNWNELLCEAESKIFTYIFWFDLHYYVYICLKNKEIYNIEIYLDFIKNFVYKLPRLLELKFENGLTFANTSTKLWINGIVGKSDVSEHISGEKHYLQTGFELISKDKIIEAIKFFLNEAKKSKNKKTEVEIIMELVTVLKNYKYNDLAFNYLDFLLEISIEYKLHEWDPDIAVKIYKLLLEANTSMEYDIKSDKLNMIKKNLASLDLELYLSLLT